MRDQSTLLVSGVLCSLAMTPVMAQSQSEPAVNDLEEVIVTAQKRSERLQDVPVAISVLDAAKMSEQGSVWAKLGARFGKREACIGAYVGLGLCWLALLVLPAGQWWLLYPLMIVFGFFNAGEQLLPNAMVPDTVEYDEMISGARREGTIYGAWVFVQQTGMAFGSFLVGVLLSTIGFEGVATADESVAEGIRYTIAVLPALCVFIGALIVRRYPLSVSEFARIQTILVERRAPRARSAT